MYSKLIGGILLIVGTSIGGGMLALPMATAAGGYVPSIFLFLIVWVITVIAAFLILEVNLALPDGTNLVTMAKRTLGPLGQIITWVCYLFLLYALLCAYIAGGGDLLQSIFHAMHWHVSSGLSAFLFVLLLGAIVYHGIRVVDIANRGLMAIKLGAYALLIILLDPHINMTFLNQGHYPLLLSAVLVVVTAFGYSIIIPSLRTYFKSDVKLLRIILSVGSLIPLVCYLLWDMAVQGTVSSYGPHGLVAVAKSSHSISDLTHVLSANVHSFWVGDLVHVFTYICITTSFLGVSLCLTDFLADGFQINKEGWHRWLIMVVAFMPPLLIVIFFPGIFIKGLAYAGIFCVFLLMVIPVIMAWSGRYVKQIITGYRFMGGRIMLIGEFIVTVGLVVLGIVQLH